MSNNIDSIDILLEEKKRLLERVATIDSLIELIEKKTPQPYQPSVVQSRGNSKSLANNQSLAYTGNQSQKNKVLLVIKHFNRFLHSSEIRNEISKIDNTPSEDVNISSTLSQLRRLGKITKVQVGKQNRNTFWGSPKWVNENDEILEGYEYNEDLLSDSDETEVEL